MLGVTIDEEAGDSLIKAGLSLCKKIVNSLINRLGLPSHLRDDLIGAAHLGLTQALKRYRPDAGGNFLSFASVRIRGSCIDFLRTSEGLPQRVYRMIKALRNVTDAEETCKDDFTEILCYGALTFKLTMFSDSDSRLASIEEGPEITLEKKQITDALREFVNNMPSSMRDLYKKCYEGDMDFADYAREKRVSRSAVSKLNKRLLAALKNKLHENGFFS